jgi:hypothetical protein
VRRRLEVVHVLDFSRAVCRSSWIRRPCLLGLVCLRGHSSEWQYRGAPRIWRRVTAGQKDACLLSQVMLIDADGS